ncbi:MAG: 6-phosphogluconolactonase [Gammaproteobacteria bacterium]|nr:MAG: 6-phosphogluconolactonase [Gammaproteobacteria bacterium]
MAEFKVFASRQAAAAALAEKIGAALAAALARRDSASLVVSGGASPLAAYQALRRHDLPWHRVTILPSDERLVPLDHPHSNAGMLRRELLQEAAAAATLLPLAAADGSTAVVRLGQFGRPLDLVLLGMGDDGHTASLFPNAPDIAGALDSREDLLVQQPPHLQTARVSLTPNLLLDAREIVLLFFGSGKRAVYARALGTGATAQLPIRFVLRQQLVPVVTYWAR